MRNFRDVRTLSEPRSTRSLLVLFVCATVVPLILLVILPLQMAKSALSAQSTDRVADTSYNAADTLRLQIDSLKALTATYAQRSDIVNAAGGKASSAVVLRTVMREFQQANPAIKASLLMNAQGTIVSLEPTSPVAVGKDYSFRDYYKGAISTDGSFVSTLFQSPAAENANYVAISHKILDGDNKTVGVLVAAVDSKAVFQSYVDGFRKNHDIALSVYDQAGQLVADETSPNAIVATADERVLAATRGSGWAGEITRDERSVIAGYSTVQGTNWVVSAVVPKADAFAPISTLETRVVITAMILGTVVLTAIVLMARSIRAREKAERRLRSSEIRTQTILDTAHQMFCELDETGRVTDWNAQAEELLGWTRDEAVGRDVIDLLVPEERRDVHRAEFAKLVEAGESGAHQRRETVLLSKKTGEMHLPVEVSGWLTVVEGRRTVNLFVQDISDRKRLQREQEVVVKRQKALVEELRSADKAKSDFISTISHELRTPLTSITGYLEMLQDGLGGPLNENQQMMVDVIDRNSQRLLTLIEDVLTLSRLESGAARFKKQEAEIRSLVSAAVETLLPQIHNNGLVLEVDVAYSCGSVVGDIDQLERVLINLLNNAVKFTPEGGRLSINAYRNNDTVTISVSDTGVGIPVEEQPHLFSRFFRASTAQNAAVQGTGLGLTIVKQIVERHGGSVSLQSATGVGTTVYVELPVVNADIPAATQN